MTKELYEKISRPFNEGTSKTLLLITNKLLTAIGYAAYPLMLIYMFFKAPEKLVATILIPGTGFVLLTRCRGAQLVSIRQMSGQVSRGSAGEYQADDPAGVARLSWRVSGR